MNSLVRGSQKYFLNFHFMKKIYLVSQNVNNGYDTYDAFIVCTSSEDEARYTMPDGSKFDEKLYNKSYYSTWTHPEKVSVLCLGKPDK